MKPLLRQMPHAGLIRPRSQVRQQSSSFICSRCRRQALLPIAASVCTGRGPTPTKPAVTSTITRRHASNSGSEGGQEKIPYTEKLRRKIWGTDLPPGQRDPYARLTPEQRQREVEERELERAEKELAEEEARLAAQGKSVDSASAAAFEPEVESASTAELAVDPEQGYIPAATADGLERLGGATGWWEEAWDKEHQYNGFIPAVKVDPAAVEGLVRRALIEVLTLEEAQRPLTDVSMVPVHTNFDYQRIHLELADGKPRLSFEHEDDRQHILNGEVGEGEDEVVVDAEVLEPVVPGVQMEAPILADQSAVESGAEAMNADNATSTLDTAAPQAEDLDYDSTKFIEEQAKRQPRPAWHEVPIDGGLVAPDFKFAFIKRVVQLTGARIPDPAISQLHLARHVLTAVKQDPKPKKLAEILLARSDLMALPNVEIYDRRYTPIDKEKELGRWKIIEEELQKRGLPVTGNY